MCMEVQPNLLKGLATIDAAHNICAVHVVLPRMIMRIKESPSVPLETLFTADKSAIATPIVSP